MHSYKEQYPENNNQHISHNDYQNRNSRPFNSNKFSQPRFNPNVINELRDKNITITWEKEGDCALIICWNVFRVLNTFYSYGEGWMKLLAVSSNEKDDLPQELLDNPLFIRLKDIKYFMITLEK